MTKKFLPALCIFALVICALPLMAASGVQVNSNAVVNYPVRADVSAPMSSYPAEKIAASSHFHTPLKPKAQQLRAQGAVSGHGLGRATGVLGPLVGVSFDALSGDPGSATAQNCPLAENNQVAPPDTEAAVGDTQVVEWVNLCYAVYDKATGNLIAGPFAGNHFWSGFGGVCQIDNDGDPIIQFDKANHVWLASQNVFSPFATCIAVSTTNDATGTYNRYQFSQPGFPDYPKWGLQPHAYFQTQNNFGTGSAYVGATVCAYQADAIRSGSKKAKQICIVDNSNNTLFDDSLVPADNDTVSTAAGASPEVFLGSIDNANPGSNVYQYVMTVSFKGKGKANLSGVNGSAPIGVPAYSLACGGFGACIPQPSAGSEVLDALGDRLMYRLARFDDGTTQHFLITHSVNDTAATGARWYEFRAPEGSTALSLYQTGQTPDDGEYRWMGSAAMDKFGDIGLGYSRSSATAGDYPSIYTSGQTAGEATGTTDAEVLIKQGSGSQFSTANRWGDYSSMALDVSDSCSFWYAQEFYPFDGTFQWYTHVAQVKFPSCP